MSAGNRVALYRRLSPYGKKAKRDQKVMSIAEQDKLMRRQAKQHDLEVVAVFTDDGVSAFNDEPEHRPGFVEMCAFIEDGGCDYIAATAGDRFARSNAVMDWLLGKCVRHDVKMLKEGSISDPGSSPAAKAMAQIEGVMGEMESAIKSARVRRARAVSAEQGRPHGGIRPFGYNDDRRTLHPVEGPAYRDLFVKVIDGMGLPTIASQWERDGILNSKGHRFDVSVLAKLVKAPRAIGLRVHQKEVVGPGDWEPITTGEVQERAKAALKGRRRYERTCASPKRPPRLLSSFLVCRECGETLRARTHRGVVRYLCEKSKSRSCGKTTINAEPVEREIELQFLGLLTDPKTLRALRKRQESAPDLAEMYDEVERIRTDRAAYAAEAGSGELSRSEWQIIRKGLDTRLDKAQAALETAAAVASVTTLTPDVVLAGWADADIDDKRRFLGAYLDSVIVASALGSAAPRGTVNLDRLDPKWI